MKKIYSLLFLIPFFSLSQIKPKIIYNDLQRMNLKGKVKEVKEVDFRIENDVIIETKEKDYYQFFINGKLIKKENFISKSISLFSYDNKGRILSEKTISPNNEQNSNYTYPKDSVAIITITNGNYISTSKNIFKKDYEIETQKVLNVTEYRETYKYDKRNRIISSLGLHYYPNKVDTIKITANYRKKCLMPIMQSFEKPFFKNILNSNCDIINHTTLQKDGAIVQKSEFTYMYDKKKNWVERKTYSDGNLIKSTRRQITYY